MSSIKLTVRRLYQLRDERLVATQATARIWLDDRLIATEEISGMTESPVSKYLHAASVTWVERCPCCQEH